MRAPRRDVLPAVDRVVVTTVIVLASTGSAFVSGD
jgi:hypothetical protein